MDPAKRPWNSRKRISIARVIFSINLSHGFTPIPHLDPAKSPWNSRKLISIARVIFSISLSHGFTLIPHLDPAKSPWNSLLSPSGPMAPPIALFCHLLSKTCKLVDQNVRVIGKTGAVPKQSYIQVSLI